MSEVKRPANTGSEMSDWAARANAYMDELEADLATVKADYEMLGKKTAEEVAEYDEAVDALIEERDWYDDQLNKLQARLTEAERLLRCWMQNPKAATEIMQLAIDTAAALEEKS